MEPIRRFVVAACGAIVVVALLALPSTATGQCDPTCAQACKAQLKACTASVKQAQAIQLAQCTMSAKTTGAVCTFLVALGKSTACLGKCGMALADCKAEMKDAAAACKADVKSQGKACRVAVKQTVAQGTAGCDMDRDACLHACTMMEMP